jgi:CBS domain containing-hemolysin-like protein
MSAGLVLVSVALLLGNGLFVGAEFAVISARRSSIELRADDGSRAARTVLWAMENVPLMLACAQIGVTVCSVSLGVVTEPALAHVLEPVVEAAHLPDAASHGLAVAVALLLISGLHVIVGEMVPKNAAVSSPDRAALILGPVLVAITRVLSPIIVALNWMANVCVRALGAEVRDEVTSAFTADEVHSIVERSSAEGTLDDAHGLLTGAIEFSDHTAGDVMVPIAKVRTVPTNVTVADVEEAVAETGFSRFPVREGERIVGYLHLKDVLYAQPSERNERVQGWRVRHLPIVTAADAVESVLRRMSESGAHIAGVEEAGVVTGVVFLEDILEELVGEVGGRGVVTPGA